MNSWLFFISVCMIFSFAKSTPGGWTQVTDLNSPDIQRNSKKAAQLVSETMDSDNIFKFVDVTEAATQVVAGKNYKLKMKIAPTECEKSENLTEQQIEGCPLQECGIPYECRVIMWVRPWLNSYEITEKDCQAGEASC